MADTNYQTDGTLEDFLKEVADFAAKAGIDALLHIKAAHVDPHGQHLAMIEKRIRVNTDKADTNVEQAVGQVSHVDASKQENT